MPLSLSQSSSTSSHDQARNLTLLFVSTGTLFGIYGTGVGSLMLASLSGFGFPLSDIGFPSHPYAQIYGFIFEFIMGVAYILVPRFKGERLAKGSITAAYSSYMLVTFANVGFVILGYVSSYSLMVLSSFLFLAGTGIFAVQTTMLAFKRKGGFSQTNPLFVEASLSAFLSGIILASTSYTGFQARVDVFSQPMIYLNLLGFASSMIYAVQIRSVSFRQSDYRTGAAHFTWITQGLAIILCFFAVVLPSQTLLLSSGVFYLAAAISASVSLKLFRMGHPLMYRPAMTETHYRITKYNDFAMITSFVWLFLALSLGVLMLLGSEEKIGLTSGLFLWDSIHILDHSPFSRDLFIHSIAIGFIGLSIICYAPMLLPGLLGRRGPTTGLSYYPMIILNLGMLFRGAGDVVAMSWSRIPYWEAASGPLILLAMGSFLWMMHTVGRGKAGVHNQSKTVSLFDERSLESVAEIRIVEPSLGEGEHRTVFWFVYRFPNLYLLLRRSEDSGIIEGLKGSKYVIFQLREWTFRANIELYSDRKAIDKVIKLFKAKYGQRNFRNVFGTGKDSVVVIMDGIRK